MHKTGVDVSPSDLFNIVPSENGVWLTIPTDVEARITINDPRACDFLMMMMDAEVGQVQEDSVVPLVWSKGQVAITAFDTRKTSLDCAKEFEDQVLALKAQTEEDFKRKLKELNGRLRVTMRNRHSGAEPVSVEKHI